MSQITLTVPDETALALKLSSEGFAAELRLAVAMKLYELGRLSAGAAAELAGVPGPVFLMKLADYGVPALRQTQEELLAELANQRDLIRADDTRQPLRTEIRAAMA